MDPWITQEEWSAIRLSLLVASTATLGSLPAGVAIGYLLARRSFWGKSVVETLVHLPLVTPPVVTGYLLLVLLGRRGPIGSVMEAWLGVSFVFDWKGAALASAVMGFPLMVRAIRLAFVSVDPRLPEAAQGLGASPWRAFATVTLPLASHGLIAGALLAFARSLGEFGATIMIAGNIAGETRTIPLAIYSALASPGGMEYASRLVVLSIVVAAGALVAGEALDRRSRRRLAA